MLSDLEEIIANEYVTAAYIQDREIRREERNYIKERFFNDGGNHERWALITKRCIELHEERKANNNVDY